MKQTIFIPIKLLLLCNFHFVQPQLHYLPEGFFPSSDVTSVTWGHGINSQQALDETLADPSIRMIESDLLRGRLNTSGIIAPWDSVIMAHPPANTSDLSFVSFIDQVIEWNKDKSLDEMKGVKLDFKDYFAAVGAITNLRTRNTTSNGTALRFPVWLNADVLRGPVNSTGQPKVNGVTLLQMHDISLPNAVLSLGWTTRFGPQSDGQMITEGTYTREHMDEMIQVFRNFSGNPEKIANIPVTFPLRVCIAQNSLGNLAYLLNSTSLKSSITLWTGANDPKANVTLLDDLLKVIGKHRVFVDLPYDDWKVNSAKNLEFNFVNLLFIVLTCLVRYITCKLCV